MNDFEKGDVMTANFSSTVAGVFPERKFIFPAASDRKSWERSAATPRGSQIAAGMIKRAEALLDAPIPTPAASDFMRFELDGDRKGYEQFYYQRRINLNILVIAECFEYKRRFIPRIIDYLWEVTSEHTWCLPAHIHDPNHDPLPFLQREELDLFASETGMNLALVLELIEAELNTVSPNMVRIVKRELMTRVVDSMELQPLPFPFISYRNNWVPWCSRNCVAVVMTMLKDQPERREKIISFFKDVLTGFIRNYPADGCCDEGPSYWAVSPGVILSFYELLNEMPEDQEKYALMADYICHAQLTDKHFAAFTDATPQVSLLPGTICFRFGERTGNPRLKKLGLTCADLPEQTCLCTSNIYEALSNIFWYPANPGELEEPGETSLKYYNVLQTMYLKDRGIALAIKRGYRGSHYHMDIGQFVIHNQGEPVVVDLGGPVYSRAVFDEDRYKHWVINCEAHNIPQFNGITQKLDVQRDDAAACLSEEDGKCVFRMDLSSAYPEEAMLDKITRTVVYNYADKSVIVEDHWELKRDDNRIRIPFYIPGNVCGNDGNYRLNTMNVNVSAGEVVLTPKEIDDAKISAAWGREFTLMEVLVNSGRSGSVKLHFTQAE